MSTTDPPRPLPGARLLFSLDASVAYLNHGGFGAVPVPVQRAQQRLRDEMESNPSRFFTRGLTDRLAHVRRHLAAFVGADPAGSALVPNVSAGVAVVLRSIGLRAGDEVLTTDHGYGAVAVAVAEACRASGAVHRVVAVPLESTSADVVDTVRAAVGDRTRLLVVDQVTSSTARQLPVPELVLAVGTRVPVLVDAAHAPGTVTTPVSALGADFWVGSLHKWALAPRPTALLTVTEAWRHRISPLVASWEHASGYPSSLECQGTLDYTAWLAAPTGLFALRSLGAETVRAHNAALAAYGQGVVGRALGVDPRELPGAGDGLPMRVIPLPAGAAATPQAALALRRRIADELATEVAVNSVGGRGLLRLSAQVYNRADEYDRLAERLPGILR